MCYTGRAFLAPFFFSARRKEDERIKGSNHRDRVVFAPNLVIYIISVVCRIAGGMTTGATYNAKARNYLHVHLQKLNSNKNTSESAPGNGGAVDL